MSAASLYNGGWDGGVGRGGVQFGRRRRPVVPFGRPFGVPTPIRGRLGQVVGGLGSSHIFVHFSSEPINTLITKHSSIPKFTYATK